MPMVVRRLYGAAPHCGMQKMNLPFVQIAGANTRLVSYKGCPVFPKASQKPKVG